MKKILKDIFSFLIFTSIIVGVLYVSFFTDIPTKTGNIIRLKIEEANSKYVEYDEDFKINNLGIKMNSYYYNKLTYTQKKIYTSIANAVKNFESEFAIRDYYAGDKDEFANEVSISIEAFINDHPEAFYLKSQYSSYVLTSFNGNIGYVKLNYTEQSIEDVNKKLNIMEQCVNEYVKEVSGLSEYEKELKIHDMIANSVTYSKLEELPREYHTIEGTFIEKTGVCDSFTKALQVIYNKVGIDSIIVLGTLEQNPHAWNLVKIDDEWYHVDITSSRSIYDETQLINHAYFNLTDDAMKKICTFDTPDILPIANSTKYNYYTHNNYIIKDDEGVASRLEDICNRFEDDKYIEFYLEGNVSERISSVLVSLRRIDPLFLSGSKMYYYNIQNAIIIPKN